MSDRIRGHRVCLAASSNGEVAALVSLTVGTVEALLASAHRRLWILTQRELA